MQLRAGVGAQAYDIAGVGGDLRLEKYDVEHVSIMTRSVLPTPAL